MNGAGAHVIVLGNEKGGSGKSTTAFHLAIFLLYKGYKVATIDVDSRQRTLTKYVNNRLNWCQKMNLDIVQPEHYHLPIARSDSIRENDKEEFELFRNCVVKTEQRVDFLIIDTPGFDTHLTRLSHSLADTLITPLNDSLIDLDVMVKLDPKTGDPVELGHYSRLVQRARKERMVIDGRTIDWVLVRNRLSMLSSKNSRLINSGLEKLAIRIGARIANGISDRVIFRSLFPIGMTVFDNVDSDFLGPISAKSQQNVQNEYALLVEALKLPIMGEAKFPLANNML